MDVKWISMRIVFILLAFHHVVLKLCYLAGMFEHEYVQRGVVLAEVEHFLVEV